MIIAISRVIRLVGIGGLFLAVFLHVSGTPAAVLYREAFSNGAGGFTLAPPAHAGLLAMRSDSAYFGAAPPSLRVDVPLHTFNYELKSPWIALPTLDADYTVQFSLSVNQPDFPFRVDLVTGDAEGNWIERRTILDLAGESSDSLRTFAFSFHPSRTTQAPGGCALLFGLPYVKFLHAGSFRIDDVELREGNDAGGPLEIYLSPGSCDPGGNIEVHVSSPRGTARMRIFREGANREPIGGAITIGGLTDRPIPAEVWRVGCGWPVGQTIAIGMDWSPGVYEVEVDDGDCVRWAPFVVRGAGGGDRLLVVLPTHTDQAYNAWGGRSFYTAVTTPEASFDRPTPSSLYMAPIHLIRWLSREGIDFDMATDDDLHDHPEILFRYRGIILTWHSEYWTRRMREGVEAYIDGGGSVLALCGNTCWWQTRIEGEGSARRLVGYKDGARADPYWKIDPALVTSRWDEPPVNDPPSRFLGLSWRYGGMVNWQTGSDCPCLWDWQLGHGGYAAFHTDHWVFAGTGLSDGDTLGRGATIVGYEVDGAPISWSGGVPSVRGVGGTPPGFVVLGEAPCWSRYAADSTGVALMGILERGDGSFVFNGGTTGWCWGLAADPVVQRITRNLIDRIPERAPSPVSTRKLEIDAYPTPATRGITFDLGGFGSNVGDGPGSGGGRLNVYDVAGSLVISRSSHRRVFWDLHDSSGRPVASGIYWAVHPGAAPRRFLVVR